MTRFFSIKSMANKGGAERYAAKAERYAAEAERYAAEAERYAAPNGTLCRTFF